MGQAARPRWNDDTVDDSELDVEFEVWRDESGAVRYRFRVSGGDAVVEGQG